MPERNYINTKKRSLIRLVCIISLIVISVGVYFFLRSDQNRFKQYTGQQQSQILENEPEKKFQPVPKEKVIDFNRVEEDKDIQATILERKEQFGLEKGVDAIVRLDESFKVGDSIIPMSEILEKIRIKRGELAEEGLGDKPADKSLEKSDLAEINDHSFGIYIVKPNDNLWNIHFRFLKEYFAKKNINLSPMADKPDSKGFSSGVGKILKFSEKIVYIYNIREHKLDVNLDLIHPESKIVVFHMAEILSLLGQLDLENVNMIRFDGENLWILAES